MTGHVRICLTAASSRHRLATALERLAALGLRPWS